MKRRDLSYRKTTYHCKKPKERLTYIFLFHTTNPTFVESYQSILLKNISDAVIITDLQFVIKSWNSAAEGLYGWTSEEAVGKRMGEIVPTRYQYADGASVMKAFFQTGNWKGEAIQVHREGQELYVLASVTMVRDEQGNPVSVLAINRDITKRKEAEEALLQHRKHLEELVRERTKELNLRIEEVEQLNLRLKAANEELEAFSFSVSHDLRSPLRHINGFIHLLQKRLGANLDATSSEYLQISIDAVQRMKELIDALLTFSRTNRKEMQVSEVDLGVLVREVQQELLPDYHNRNIRWTIGELPLVQGDPGLLRIALSNLLSNAIKYSASREIAAIEIGIETEVISGELSDGSMEFVLFVRDNGVGFDDQHVEKIFRVFQRLHSPDQFEGSGIGLATVRRIVQRHGGRIWASSSLDQGATFYLSLQKARSLSM